MIEIISNSFAPLIGLPCWGVDRAHGSLISLEFGSPHLHIREPIASVSSSAKVREQMARRLVKPVGEWSLFVSACHWRAVALGETLAEDADAQEQIESALRSIDGQKLTAFRLDAASRTTTLVFDLGATLTTWPYAADNDEQWSLYRPDGLVLIYRADGQHSFAPGDEKSDRQAWHPVSRDVLVP